MIVSGSAAALCSRPLSRPPSPGSASLSEPFRKATSTKEDVLKAVFKAQTFIGALALVAGLSHSAAWGAEILVSGPSSPSATAGSMVETPSLAWSTYLGGTDLDSARGVALDSEGNAYIVGLTYSPDFPLASPGRTPFQRNEAFVVKGAPAGTGLSSHLAPAPPPPPSGCPPRRTPRSPPPAEPSSRETRPSSSRWRRTERSSSPPSSVDPVASGPRTWLSPGVRCT